MRVAHIEQEVVLERVALGFYCPLGLAALLEDLLAELNSLLWLEPNQEVASFAVDAGFVLEQLTEVLGDLLARVDRQNAAIKKTMVLLLGPERFEVVVGQQVEVHV